MKLNIKKIKKLLNSSIEDSDICDCKKNIINKEINNNKVSLASKDTDSSTKMLFSIKTVKMKRTNAKSSINPNVNLKIVNGFENNLKANEKLTLKSFKSSLANLFKPSVIVMKYLLMKILNINFLFIL